MSTLPTYVIITPARNEEQFIELTLRSVLAQTVRPLKYIVVSDGSTDGTDEIAQRCAAQYSWIEFIRIGEAEQRNFAGKVRAFDAGYRTLTGLDYEAIACLDADVSFEPQYFSFLLSKLAEDATLGVVGTPFKEAANPVYDYRFVNIEHVSGACQVFRRKCFEDIGGYSAVKGGCVDHIAVLTARMRGWKTRTFPEQVCFHHRTMGTAQHSRVAARFRNGVKDYSIGNHPIWELSRVAYQMSKRPYVIGAVALLAGYLWSLVRRLDRPVSRDLVEFQRREQMQRLRRLVLRTGILRKGALAG